MFAKNTSPIRSSCINSFLGHSLRKAKASARQANCRFNADANTGHAFGIFMASVGALLPVGLRRRLTWALACSKPALFRLMLYSPAFIFSSVIHWVFCRVPDFALEHCAGFKLFWPPSLAQRASAIIFQALRRLRGALLFRGLRPSSSWGFPFWRLGLTVQSSRPAFGGRLTFVRYPFQEIISWSP